ncbi:MAG: GGDEF domain-containing protein [Oricola sp.]
MPRADRIFDKFKALPIWQQSLVVVLGAIAGSDLLTLAFYSVFFSDRLTLDLLLTAIIAVLVAFPISLVVLHQTAKIARLAENLREASETDHLTHLYNRRQFMISVGDALQQSEELAGAGTVLFIDADYFKRINDTYGHGVGDEVLVNIGAVIRECVRGEDVAARIGGEEFAVFLRRADMAIALRTAERIRSQTHRISRAMNLTDLPVTVSIGIARHHKGQGLEEVLRAADRALYAAKAKGRDQVVGDACLPTAA